MQNLFLFFFQANYFLCQLFFRMIFLKLCFRWAENREIQQFFEQEYEFYTKFAEASPDLPVYLDLHHTEHELTADQLPPPCAGAAAQLLLEVPEPGGAALGHGARHGLPLDLRGVPVLADLGVRDPDDH